MAHEPAVSHQQPDPDFLQGGGENGARMRAIDWSQTALGPAADWPQSLKTCIRIILTSRQPMFVWWGEQLINLYNDAYKAIVGGKHPWALGTPAAEVWREIWEEVGPRAETAMLSNEGTYDEALLLIMERYGYPEETYYTFSYSPVPNDEGGTGGILCANTDDTQRIVGERQLALLRALAAHTVDARTLEDACIGSARALLMNPRDIPFAMLYLVDRDRGRVTLAGCAGIDADHPAAPHSTALEDVMWPCESVLQTQKPALVTGLASTFGDLPTGPWERAPYQAVVHPISVSGHEAAVLILGLNPFRLYDDNFRRFIELVSSQVGTNLANAQAYADERRRAESLAELDRAKTAFFSNVSHEFRTPLTLMLGPLEDILAKPEHGVLPENRQLLEVMHRNGQRLLKLVNTLLDFSRIEAGRVQASFEPTDLATYTAELASVFRAAVDKAGMTLTIDAPPLSNDVFVDRDMWEKVVLNLVSNAFKYTLEGEIAVRVREEDSHAIVTVRDTGIGVPAHELPKLFHRFHRVEGARGRTQEGSGIGLALVQELVRLHGGTVSAESEEGEGSTFTVSIPFGTEHLPQDRLGSARTMASTNIDARQFVEEALRWLPDDVGAVQAVYALPTASDGTRGTIVLADDNADMRDYVQRLLTPSYDVMAVADGEEALRAAIEELPDLVLTDVMMPKLDGFGLLRELRANLATASIPVIMLSARAGEEARVEGLRAGADDYVVKPFSARELLARVGGLLATTRARQEALHLERRLQQALESERIVLRDIFARAPAFIATMRGPELVFDIANSMFMKVVGEGRTVIGKPAREALPEAESQGLLALLEEVYRSGEPVVGHEVPISFQRDSDLLEEHFVDFVYQPIRERDGTITGIFMHGNDVSEQVRARQIVERQAEELERANLALMQAQESLKEADRRKDEFIATLSHELRTPLTAILGWASMLKMGGNDAATVRAAIETIDQSARAQAQLIDDVLDISRITSGKVRIASEKVDVASVAASAIDTVRLAASARGVRLNHKIDGEGDAGALVILGDGNRLQQIIWNLLSNAIKFTPEGGEVRMTLSTVGSAIIIQVRDSGIGIKPDFLPHVFEAFRQAESTSTRVHGGLGLGLSIVRYLVELHGGQITAESEGEGKGATFTVELPRLKSWPVSPRESSPAELHEVSDAPVASTIDLRGVNVLVIDDQPSVRNYLSAVLRRSGAEVRNSSSVQEAVSEVEEQLPDVVLCDIAMPHEDGFAFIAWMRSVRLPRRVPVLAITAFGRPEDEVRVRQSGFDGYIRKPVEPDVLAEAVASARIT